MGYTDSYDDIDDYTAMLEERHRVEIRALLRFANALMAKVPYSVTVPSLDNYQFYQAITKRVEEENKEEAKLSKIKELERQKAAIQSQIDELK